MIIGGLKASGGLLMILAPTPLIEGLSASHDSPGVIPEM